MQLPGVYGIVDTSMLSQRGCANRAVEVAEGMLEGGIRLLQFRHKEHFSRLVFEWAGRIAALCRQVDARFVVNDRADIALLLDGGVHVGQDDLSPATVRRLIGEHILLGLSTHNAEQLSAADREPVDYVAVGPVFATGSKKNPSPVLGVEALRQLRQLTAKPLVAIGGITHQNAAQVWEAGADAVAVIGGLLPQQEVTRLAVRERAAKFVALWKGML